MLNPLLNSRSFHRNIKAKALTVVGCLIAATAHGQDRYADESVVQCSYDGHPSLEMFDRDVGYFYTDELLTGPVGLQADCSLTSNVVAGRFDATASIQSVTDFGSRSSLSVLEGSDNLVSTVGLVLTTISRPDASITEIPFTISDLSLEIEQFSIASAGLTISLFETFQQNGATQMGDLVSQFTAHTFLRDSGDFFVESSDAAFEAGFTEESDVTITIPGAYGPDVRDSATYSASITDYTHAIDISGMDFESDYLLGYYFETSLLGRYAQVVFQDPLEFGGVGGFFDTDVMAALTPAGSLEPPLLQPAAVPLPSGIWLFGSAMMLLLFGKRRNSAAIGDDRGLQRKAVA